LCHVATRTGKSAGTSVAMMARIETAEGMARRRGLRVPNVYDAVSSR